jgi:hypothetical protein
MAITLNNGTDYINTNDYRKLENRLEELKSVLEDLIDKSVSSRKLRYSEVDIEVEREAGRIQPDELYIPSHIIDTNIRREQASYVQYITQSPRAIVIQNKDDPSVDMTLLEKDLSDKLRYDGWQMAAYANIDGFQANGYGIKEICYDDNKPGDLVTEFVQLGDFAFVADTRDLQAVEMVAREYHYTKTRLVALASPTMAEAERWDIEQVNKVIGKDSSAAVTDPGESTDSRDKSLYRVQKVMYRVNGIVQVAWACIGVADDWLRKPRDLYLGRRQLTPETSQEQQVRMLTGNNVPPSTPQFEADFPYVLYQYLISENDTIAHLKGRVFLDQDAQEGVSSLMSSTLTQARRASGLYFSKEVSDPNDDILLQKNIFFRQGALINSAVKSFKLDAPDPGIFPAIQALVTSNQNETSQVSFAVNNRKDSRKTAEEMKLAQNQQNILSTVQVVLYSISLTSEYRVMCDIIKSRVLAGLIKPNPKVLPLYSMNWIVKPAGDTDVIEKQQLIQTMMSAWSVIENTAAAPLFLIDLIEKMFPDNAAKYIQAIQQAAQQAQSQQAQQQQQFLQVVQQMAQGIIQLSKEREMFSETGKIHALPVLEQAARQIETIEKQMQPQQQKKG